MVECIVETFDNLTVAWHTFYLKSERHHLRQFLYETQALDFLDKEVCASLLLIELLKKNINLYLACFLHLETVADLACERNQYLVFLAVNRGV